MAKKVVIDIDIKGTKDVIELQKQARELKKQLRVTDQDTKGYDDLAKQLVIVQSQLKEARKAQRQAVDAFAATDDSIGAYSRLSAQLRVARNRLKDLQASGETTGDEIDKLTKEVNELDSTLKDIDRSVGQANREIGQYEEAVRKAIGVTDAQTGAYTRLTGRLNVLKKAYQDVSVTEGKTSDQAKKLRKEITALEKQLGKTSKAATKASGRIGGIRTQLRGLGGGFTNLASSFIIFSELPQALTEINEGFEQFASFVSPAEALNQRFGESIKEAAVQLANEKAQLDRSFDAVRQAEKGTKEYDDAVKDLTESYGPYLDDIARQEIALGNLTVAQERATAALINDIAEQQKAAVARSIIERFAQEQARLLEIQADSQTKAGKIRDEATKGFLSATLGIFKPLIQEATGLGDTYTEISEDIANSNIESLKFQAASLNDFKEQLAGGLTDINKALKESGLNLNALLAEQDKERADQLLKRQQAEAKRRAEQIAKDQKRILEAEERNAKAQLEQFKRLEEQIIRAQLDAREAGLQKALDQEANATNIRIDRLKSDQAKFEAEAKERADKIAEAFGEGSKKTLELTDQINSQVLRRQKLTDEAILAETTLTEKRKADIKKSFAEKEAQEAERALQERLQALQRERAEVSNALDLELLEIREKRARGAIEAQEADTKAFNARIANIKKQLATLQNQEGVLISEQAFGAEVAQEEFDKIARARQQLNTELAELEEEQTKKVEEENQKRTDAVRQGFEFALNQFSQVAGAIGQIAEISANQEIKRVEALEEERAQNLESLNAQLQTASGLEAQFLQEQIRREEQAAQELAEKKQRIEKEAAIGAKAIAITQAVINTALGITQALATLPPPASYVAAAVTGALGAVEIATIAAQPLATGGIVGFNNGGKVNQAQNIPTQSNGDNVLATLKRGEVVLNARQQSLLGGAETFRKAGVPGFAGGGVVSPPIGVPSLAESRQDNSVLLETVKSNSALIKETRDMVLRMEVVYTTNTEDAVNKDRVDRKRIKQRATL